PCASTSVSEAFSGPSKRNSEASTQPKMSPARREGEDPPPRHNKPPPPPGVFPNTRAGGGRRPRAPPQRPRPARTDGVRHLNPPARPGALRGGVRRQDPPARPFRLAVILAGLGVGAEDLDFGAGGPAVAPAAFRDTAIVLDGHRLGPSDLSHHVDDPGFEGVG